MNMKIMYRSLLSVAGDRFADYGKNHREKEAKHRRELGSAQLAADAAGKAEVNEAIATSIEHVLALPDVELDHQQMVKTLQKPGEAILEQMTPLKIMCLHMAGGAAGEGGELFDAIKRWALFGKELDRANVIEELGDQEFFMEGLRQNLNITREETLAANRAKLVSGEQPRYPSGVFSDAATIARADKRPIDEAMRWPDGNFHAVNGTVLPPPDKPELGEPRQHADDVGGYLHVDDSANDAEADRLLDGFGPSEGLVGGNS